MTRRRRWTHGDANASDGVSNLITNQDLSSAYWTLNGFTSSGTTGVRETATIAAHTFGMTTGLTRPIGTGIYTHTVDLIKVGPDQRFLAVGLFSIGLGAGAYRFFDVLSGTSSTSSAYGGFAVANFSMTAITGGWRCSVTANCTGAAFAGIIALEQETLPQATFTFQGVVADGYTIANMTLIQVG